MVEGLGIKALVLTLLVFQNSVHTLLTGYSQKVLRETYVPSTVIILSEVIKAIVSMLMVSKEQGRGISQLVSTSAPMAVPAVIYFFNNWLAFLALKSLPPAVYATLAQLKLLTTALFAVLMLGKKLSNSQWRALILLTVGSILVQVNPCAEVEQDVRSSAATTAALGGTLIMLLYATLSGFAGIWFEKMLKNYSLTLWERNVQLSVTSIVVAIFSLIVFDFDKIMMNGFFGGYSFVTLLIACTSAIGGILVALVVKHADNIMKVIGCMSIHSNF